MEKNQKNNIEIEVRSIVSDLAIRQQEDGKPSRVITGYASKFDTWSEPIYGWFVEKIARGAFEKTDMSDVIMVFNHDISGVLARTTSGTLKLTVDEVGLRFEFDSPETTLGNDMLELRTSSNMTSAPSSPSPSSTMYPWSPTLPTKTPKPASGSIWSSASARHSPRQRSTPLPATGQWPS